MKSAQGLVIYIDGASRGNPGPAGIGVVILGPQGKTLAEESVYIGEATNNVAEYRALLLALQEARRMRARRVRVLTDSELLYRQMEGRYRVRDPKLVALFNEAACLSEGIQDLTLQHIVRSQNQRADRLANQAVDAGARESKRGAAKRMVKQLSLSLRPRLGEKESHD
jgi:ribonuclease HI